MDVPVLAYARGGGAGDAWRRGRHVCAEGSRTGGRMARRADLRRAASRQSVIAGQRRRVHDFGPNRRRAQAPAYAGDRHIVRIAFIVQRYGAEILGGSEYHCRLVAERLALRHQVDVLTTCARDYLTWANEYPEGPDRLRGVTVRRFATSKTRDLAAFNRLSDRIFHESHSAQDELEWLKQQGPWTPGLIDYLERHHQHYDVLVFFTYLYAPTVLGIKIAPSKSILVPTAHDEPAIRLDMYRDVFAAAAGIAWNTDAERRFVSSRFRAARARRGGRRLRRRPARGRCCWPSRPSRPSTPGRAASRCRRTSRDRPTRSAAAIACTIRSCCTAAASIRARAARSCSSTSRPTSRKAATPNLMLMGTKLMPLPEDPHVRFAGVLPDAERFHALEAAIGGRRAVAAREPVAARARGHGRRHARARQRAVRSARRTLPQEQRRAVLRRPLGIHRGRSSC